MNFRKIILKQFNVDKDKVNKKNLRKLISLNIKHRGTEYNNLSEHVKTRFTYLANHLKEE